MIPTERPALPQPGAGDYDLPASDYLHLRDYVQIVYRRVWLIVTIVSVGLLSGLLYVWLTTPIFEARATLQIDMDLNVLGVDRPLLPLDQRDWMREFLPTQLGILQSRDLARAAREELLAEESSASDPDASAPQVPTLGEIMAGRSVSQVRDSRLVNVVFRATDPEVSARVANALAQAYVRQNQAFKVSSSGEASDWLEKQVEEQRKRVEQSEATLQRYRLQHGADALMTDRLGVEQQNIVVQRLAELQNAETEARTETIDREAQYKQLQAAQARREPLDTVPAIASSTFIQGLKAELATLQRELSQASKELGERHPDLIKLQDAVQNAERKVQAEIATAARAIQNNYETARQREVGLVAALQRQKSEVRALNGKAVEYTTLEREATTNREVLDTLLQRSREASLAQELQSTNVRVVDQAEVPVEPVIPRTQRTLMIALTGSGGLALGLVFLLELFNNRIRTPEDVRQHLRLPVVGVVPQVKAVNGEASLLLGSGAPAQFTELFHGVRTNLVLTSQLATGHTLLITSSAPSEGKTLSAANLAVSLARLKQRVILVDADMRRPRQHEVFGVQQQPGLAEVLSGKASSLGFHKTKVPGLVLMPAGSTVQNPADLLGSEQFKTLIEHLQKHFDWIVLDSSPVMAVTDACLIARVASGVLLVVDSGSTTREVAAAAVDRLDAVGANMVGAMLNRVVIDRRGESYLPYYHQDYETYYAQANRSFPLPEVPTERLTGKSAEAQSSAVDS